MNMHFILQRFADNRESTLGLLFKVGVLRPFKGYTLEDEFRESKLSGETRIPAGIYKLVIQKSMTPKTIAYRKKYPWFENHIMVENVPGFIGIYIHVGNTDDHTDGCILLGDGANNNTIAQGAISTSTEAFRRFYIETYEDLKAGHLISLEIRDETYLNIKKPAIV